MPTLFERLDTGVGGTDLSVKLTVQTGQLGSLATTVRSLITNPPSSLDDLTASLGDLPVPDLGVGPQFTGMLGDLRAAVPTDISSVIGPLTTGLGELETTIGPGLTNVLAGALDVVLAVERLATTDFRCLGVGAGARTGERERRSARPRQRGAPPPENGGRPAGGGTATATAATTASASRVNELLDRFPTPLTIPGFLGFVATLLDDPERDTLLPHVFPLLDGVRDPLLTLVAWDDMTGAEIRADFASTLGASRDLVAGVGAGAVGSVAADVVAASSGLPIPALAQIADGLAARLQELATAVTAGNLAGTGPAVGALNALLDQYDALRADLEEPLADLADLSSRVGAHPGRPRGPDDDCARRARRPRRDDRSRRDARRAARVRGRRARDPGARGAAVGVHRVAPGPRREARPERARGAARGRGRLGAAARSTRSTMRSSASRFKRRRSLRSSKRCSTASTSRRCAHRWSRRSASSAMRSSRS